jgi:hypothetical protein
MAHAQKPDFIFLRNGRVHLNRPGRQFSRLLAAEVCASAVVMLDALCSEVVWRVLATHTIRQFPLHFPSLASPRAIKFQLDSTLLLSPNIMLLDIRLRRFGENKWIWSSGGEILTVILTEILTVILTVKIRKIWRKIVTIFPTMVSEIHFMCIGWTHI